MQFSIINCYFCLIFKKTPSTAYYVAYEQLRQVLSGFAKLDTEFTNNLL